MGILISVSLLAMLILLLVFVFHSYSWNLLMDSSVRSWSSSFECGFVSHRSVENYFSHTYFILLVFFVVFDLEVSLLLNMPIQGVLFKNLLCYVFFLGLLSFGFMAEIYKGYVGWSY